MLYLSLITVLFALLMGSTFRYEAFAENAGLIDEIEVDEATPYAEEYADENYVDEQYPDEQYVDEYYADEYEEEEYVEEFTEEIPPGYYEDEYARYYVPKGGRCVFLTFTADSLTYPRCNIIDNDPPRIAKVFVTPRNYVCAETRDNTDVYGVAFSGIDVPKWPGSNVYFCTNEPLPIAITVIAEDMAGNTSYMVAVDRQRALQSKGEQVLAAERSLDLNPHHGVEGLELFANGPVKQLRISTSGFAYKEILVSDYAIKEFSGENTVVVKYVGQYANTLYGKERHGQVHVFGANAGHVATFDVSVVDDIIMLKNQDKKPHKPYDLDLKKVEELDGTNLNAWQQAELERIFYVDGDLTEFQKNFVRNLIGDYQFPDTRFNQMNRSHTANMYVKEK